MSDLNKVSKAELAERLGVSLTTVEGWIRSGCPIDRRGNKRIAYVCDLAAVVDWRIARAQAQAIPKVVGIEQGRARKLAAEAEMAEIELAQKRGELLPAADAEASVVALLSGVRARLLSVPTKSAPLAYSAESVQEAESIIREKLYEALEAISEVAVEVEPHGTPGDRGNRSRRRVGDEAASESDGERVGRPRAKAQRGVKRRARKVVDKPG